MVGERVKCARFIGPVGYALLSSALLLGMLATPVRASCELTAREWYNPTGWEGCTVYGDGIASRYPGPGVARNDCTYPWTSCTPITITSHQTGITITVTPRMFCDCYTGGWGTYRERLVDLDPGAVRALGLDWRDGLYPVTVAPVGKHAGATPLPDTAVLP
jgi:hypothetical protein